jgi:hypothetical protein
MTKKSGFYSRLREEIVPFSAVLIPALGPIQWVPGAFSPGLKKLEREGDHTSS